MARRRQFSPQIEQAITAAAERAGLNPTALKAIARIESSGNPTVQTGRYKGLFQLSDAEFRRYGGRGDIFDPVENANVAAKKLAAESARLEKRLGRTPTAGDVYLVHQQGEGGALEHRRNPDRPAWQSMFATKEGRTKGEDWSKDAIRLNIPKADLKRLGVTPETITSRQFMQLWNEKVARFAGVQSVSELAMRGTGGQATQVAEAPPIPERKPPAQVAAVSPEGLEPGASAGSAYGQAATPGEAIAQAAPDAIGPLGPFSKEQIQRADAGSSTAAPWNSDFTTEVNPELPIPASGGSIAGANSIGGGGLGLDLKGTLASALGIPTGGVFGGGGGLLGLGGKGGGGVSQPKFSTPDMGNTYAEYAALEGSMGASQDDVLPTTPPPPPPRTPQGLPVADWLKKRTRTGFG